MKSYVARSAGCRASRSPNGNGKRPWPTAWSKGRRGRPAETRGRKGADAADVSFRRSEGIGRLPRPTTYELVFFPTAKVYDGRFANNGWLQELPDPMTRLTWDNAALMNEKTAEKIGVKRDEVVALQADGTPEVEFPVLFQPGMPDGVIAVALGYGRTAAGNIGNGVGANAYLLRDSKSIERGWAVVKARPTGKTHCLATVQDHHIIDRVGKEAVQERIPELIHEGTLAEYRKDPSLGHEKSDAPSIFDEHRLDGRSVHCGHEVGPLLAASSTGASAGPRFPPLGHGRRSDGLHRLRRVRGRLPGREQHPHRRPPPGALGPRDALDPRRSLFRTTARRGRQTRQQACCPPAGPSTSRCCACSARTRRARRSARSRATTHSLEGLNMMTYNRCAGTRYCSNNCPYKVRRFNYFDFNCGTLAGPLHAQPDPRADLGTVADAEEPRGHGPHARA